MVDSSSKRGPGPELFSRAQTLAEQGRHGLAAPLYVQAGSAFADSRAFVDAVRAWRLAATAAARVGDGGQAEEALTLAVRLSRDRHLLHELALTLGELGVAVGREGRQREAASLHHEALELAEASGDARGQATHVGNLGLLSITRGDWDGARLQLRRAMDIYVRLEDPVGAATSLNALGGVERAAGSLQAAREAFEGARDLFHQAGHSAGEATAQANLGNLARTAGRLAEAEACFRAGLELARASRDSVGQSRALTDLGNIAATRGDRAAAREMYEAARELAAARGFALGLAAAEVNLGNLDFEDGELDRARAAWVSAGETFRRVGEGRAAIDVTGLIAQLDARRGELDRAEGALVEALESARSLGYDDARARIDVNLSALAFTRGRVGFAITGFRAGAAFFAARERALDQVMCHLAAAEALVVAGRPGDSIQEVAAAEDVTAGIGAEVVACEVAAMGVRVRLALVPSPDLAADLCAAADRLEAAGRTLEALSHRLIAVDAGLEAARALAVATKVLARAQRLGARTSAMDAESLIVTLGPASDPAVSRLYDLAAQANAGGSLLLGLRIRRRLLNLLAALGRDAEAELMRAGLREDAQRMGAGAELMRLGDSPAA
ncbi:MAG: tetratricopeptide repeat protein [Myxococcota bacterium]